MSFRPCAENGRILAREREESRSIRDISAGRGEETEAASAATTTNLSVHMTQAKENSTVRRNKLSSYFI